MYLLYRTNISTPILITIYVRKANGSYDYIIHLPSEHGICDFWTY